MKNNVLFLFAAFLCAVLLLGCTETKPKQSANITCVGILAHESALNGGEIKKLPDFTFND